MRSTRTAVVGTVVILLLGGPGRGHARGPIGCNDIDGTAYSAPCQVASAGAGTLGSAVSVKPLRPPDRALQSAPGQPHDRVARSGSDRDSVVDSNKNTKSEIQKQDRQKTAEKELKKQKTKRKKKRVSPH